jgi:hypothetical protein
LAGLWTQAGQEPPPPEPPVPAPPASGPGRDGRVAGGGGGDQAGRGGGRRGGGEPLAVDRHRDRLAPPGAARRGRPQVEAELPGGEGRALEEAGPGAAVGGRPVDAAGGGQLVGGDGGEADLAVLELQPGGLLVGNQVDVDAVEQGRGGPVGGVAVEGQGPAGAGRGGQAEGAVAGGAGQVGGGVAAHHPRGQRGQGDGGDQGREVGGRPVERDPEGGRVGRLEAGDGPGAAGGVRAVAGDVGQQGAGPGGGGPGPGVGQALPGVHEVGGHDRGAVGPAGLGAEAELPAAQAGVAGPGGRGRRADGPGGVDGGQAVEQVAEDDLVLEVVGPGRVEGAGVEQGDGQGPADPSPGRRAAAVRAAGGIGRPRPAARAAGQPDHGHDQQPAEGCSPAPDADAGPAGPGRDGSRALPTRPTPSQSAC